VATDPNDPTTVEHQPVLDRVMEVSKNADGTPAQMDGYEVIDPDEETVEEPAVAQVSGVVADQQDSGEESATSRRRRKANVEDAAAR